MTNDTLAQASNIAIYLTLGLLTLAMLAFAVQLAVHGSAAPRRQRALVGAGVAAEGAGAGADGVADPLGAGGTAVETGVDGAAAHQPVPLAAPTRRWGVLGMQLTWAALFALAACVALRGLSVMRPPLGNMYEFALVTCLCTLAIYAAWSLRRDLLWLGLFVTGPVLVILGVALVAWYVPAGPLLPSLNNSIWLVIHVSVATLTIGLLVIGAVFAGLYLAKDRAETRGRQLPGWLRSLPRAELLERTTYAIHIVAFPLWTFTVIAGAIWAEQAWGRYWGWDPKEVWSFVIWVVYAAYLHARATSGWSTAKATWLAVAGFGCIIINYAVVNVFFVGWHSYSGL